MSSIYSDLELWIVRRDPRGDQRVFGIDDERVVEAVVGPVLEKFRESLQKALDEYPQGNRYMVDHLGNIRRLADGEH